MAVQDALAWLTAALSLALTGYAALRYRRRRDPIAGLIALIFLVGAAVSVVESARLVTGRPLVAAVAAVSALYLLRPYLVLRLADTMRPVDRWVRRAACAGAVALFPPLLLVERPVPPLLGAAYAALFVGAEVVAARTLGAEARHRRGLSALRLRAGARGSWALVAVVAVAAGTGLLGWTVTPGAHIVGVTPAGVAAEVLYRLLLLSSAGAYFVAFVPPDRLRRLWSAAALHRVHRRITDAPATEPADRLWHRYAAAVRDATGADAVDVLLPGPAGGPPRRAAGTADPAAAPGRPAAADLAALLAAPQPVLLRPGGRGGPLAARYAAARPGARLTAVPLPGGGALVALNRGRSLFAEDDLLPLADAARQVAVLAERGALLVRQRALADELAASVAALTEAHRAKNEFLAAMSHDLRTPLHVIIGFSDLVRADLAETDPIQADWVAHIHRSGRHLLALINDLLDLAKMESGRVELDRRPVRVDAAINELLAALHPMIADRALRVDVRAARLTASADPLRFRQIVENLLSNAIKYTPPGGRVTVTAAARGADVLVRVADTGAGIDPADQDLVFRAYGRVGPERAGSTGLGLAIGRRLARAHGGDLTLSSAAGRGSTFTLTLPGALLDPPPTDPPPPATAPPGAADAPGARAGAPTGAPAGARAGTAGGAADAR
ncbi:hypothetical protein GCM10010123_31880 [Pilimelia anulata]|uniref:histidine kinase n=1 Tax=Pilimelia anulata TaxID=53371 RepID=A0A8J3B9W3_9ACTN|nr:HAMP domain-containing sensor histidine kinase [Pilimelia anulata]GGJ99588.1 hypothetical protein GCM10010123_31880 [Pilimelia anulata]